MKSPNLKFAHVFHPLRAKQIVCMGHTWLTNGLFQHLTFNPLSATSSLPLAMESDLGSLAFRVPTDFGNGLQAL